jgi:uncharacterized membrane protein
VIAPAIAVAALAWLCLLLASASGPTSLSAVMYGVGSFICHQIPERSFHLWGFQLPVCARCLGIYAGFALMASAHAGTSTARRFRPRPLTPASARWVFAIGALPTAVTLALEWSGGWRGSNVVRAIAGSVLGAGIALVVMSVVATLHYSGCEPRRPTAPSQLPPHI